MREMPDTQRPREVDSPAEHAEQDIVVNDCWNRIGVWGKEKPRCSELDKVIHCFNCKVYATSGRRLLDRRADADYMRSWAEQLAEPERKREHNTVSVVIFRIGGEWLAMATRLFQEVVEMKVVHKVPHSRSPYLRGLVNVRGELQLCVSFGRLLGVERKSTSLEATSEQIYSRLVVVAQGEHRFVFPVSEVRGIHRYTPADLQPIPATAAYCATNYLRGMLIWGSNHVGCIDEDMMFTALQRSLA